MYKFILLLSGLLFMGQASENDPKATKLLKSLDKAYKDKSLKVGFDLSLKQAESKETIQKGVFVFSSNFYKLILPDQEIYFDGQTQWTYFKDRKEVQINASSLEESSYHPLKFVKLYTTNQFKYRIEASTDNKAIIDFAPIVRDQEYHKIKMTINKKLNLLSLVEVYLKSGDRFSIKFLTQESFKNGTKTDFQLNTSSLPGVHVEDLR